MSNKKVFKEIFKKEFNQETLKEEIIIEIERKNMKKKFIKWTLAPICLVVIISGVLFLNYQNANKTVLKNKPYVDEKNNIILNINEITNSKVGMPLLDTDVKVVTNSNINFPLPYKNGIVDIPKDLDKTSKYIFYFRENKESKEYNILGYYEIIYDNGNDRSIKVSYSKYNKPARDYYFSDEGSKTTTINGVELKVYKFENIYFTEFKFNDYNFDIEVKNITEAELISLLKSIIK